MRCDFDTIKVITAIIAYIRAQSMTSFELGLGEMQMLAWGDSVEASIIHMPHNNRKNMPASRAQVCMEGRASLITMQYVGFMQAELYTYACWDLCMLRFMHAEPLWANGLTKWRLITSARAVGTLVTSNAKTHDALPPRFGVSELDYACLL